MAQQTRSTAPLLWLFAALAATGCATNPATGANQLMLVSEAQEIQMAQQADTAVIATIGLYPDHPSPANRVAAINGKIAALPQDFSGTTVNRDAYQRLLDGLVFGSNPRQGYFTNSAFFHPDLRFRLTFPAGWTMTNGAQAVVAVSPAKDAVIELSQGR